MVMCVFPGPLGEDVGELRGGMKAVSTSPQVHSPPQPRAAWIMSGALLSSAAAAGMMPLESHQGTGSYGVSALLPGVWAEAREPECQSEPGRQRFRPWA